MLLPKLYMLSLVPVSSQVALKFRNTFVMTKIAEADTI